MTFWIHAAIHLARALSEQQKKTADATSSATAKWRKPRRRAAPSEHALFVDAKWRPIVGARTVRLGVRGGEASLTLCDPAPDAGASAAWSDAVIESPSPEKGAAFVDAVAEWLDVDSPPPTRGAGSPAPFALRWSRVDKFDGVERIALSFAWNGRVAEILMHVRAGGHMVKVVEKSPEMREALVAILAVALRDGAPA